MFPGNPEQPYGSLYGQWGMPPVDPAVLEERRLKEQARIEAIQREAAHKKALHHTFEVALPEFVRHAYRLLHEAKVPPTFTTESYEVPAKGLLGMLGMRPSHRVPGMPLWELAAYKTESEIDTETPHNSLNEPAPRATKIWCACTTSLCTNNHGRLVLATAARSVEFYVDTREPKQDSTKSGSSFNITHHPLMPQDFPFADPNELEEIIGHRVQQEIRAQRRSSEGL